MYFEHNYVISIISVTHNKSSFFVFVFLQPKLNRIKFLYPQSSSALLWVTGQSSWRCGLLASRSNTVSQCLRRCSFSFAGRSVECLLAEVQNYFLCSPQELLLRKFDVRFSPLMAHIVNINIYSGISILYTYIETCHGVTNET